MCDYGKTEIETIRMSDIDHEQTMKFKYQRKIDDLTYLKESIKIIGQQVPVVFGKTKDHKVFIARGHRRYEAIRELGLLTIKGYYLI